MKLFDRKRSMLGLLVSILFLSLLLAACDSSPIRGGNNGKGCTKIGVLLPDIGASARWESKDRQLLTADIKKILPGATIDYNNAEGSATEQQNQALADLAKGDCILVVAAVDSVRASEIVRNNNIQIAYVASDRLADAVIAALKAVKLNGKVLVTGQDATMAGIQNILKGDQAMTVYKPFNQEALATAKLVAALSRGTSTASLTNGVTIQTTDGGTIPAVVETPIAVDKSNIVSTVIADGFVSKFNVCSGLPAGTNTNGLCPT